MNELHLFAGAGGGILAGLLLGHRCIGAVEFNSYCQQVLLARQRDGSLPRFPIHGDIRRFNARPYRGRIDIVAGGFPCQAYSSASRGRAVADDLWPEFRRVVADVAPRYVFAENVQRRAINRAADELEEMGYRAVCMSLSAQDVGADHTRPRHWLLAYADVYGELRGAEHAEAPLRASICPGFWETDPDESRVADGLAYRVERLRATGNGQVPVVAALAFSELHRRLNHPAYLPRK